MSEPIYFGDVDTSLITPSSWPKPNPKGPEVKNFLVEMVYDSYQVGVKISTPLLMIAGEPERNTNIKAWEIKVALDNFHKPGEVHQVEFNKKIKEIEQLGMFFAPNLIENLGVSKDTPLELGPCIYIGDNVKYPPSFRLKLDHALDAEKNVISQQFRSDVKNPLFVQLDTDKMIDITPANIKDNVKIGCKCQMALEVKGWTYRLRREDKAKGVGEAVIVRLKLAPIVIGISAPPEPTKPWDYSFSKLESKSKAHQLAEAQSTASTSMEHESDPCSVNPEKQEDESVNKTGVHSDLSEEDDVDENESLHDGGEEDSEVKRIKLDDQV